MDGFRHTGRFLRALGFLLPSTATLMVAATAHGDAVRRVLRGAPTGGDGLSWATAYGDLQDALDAAANSNGAIEEIWVAVGTYLPARGTFQRNLHFSLQNNLAILGGFAGFESMASERDPAANLTILSADLRTNDGESLSTFSDNSYHVVMGEELDSTAVLDGFVIYGGNASDFGGDDGVGGGMMLRDSAPIIQRCVFHRNRANFGAGLYAVNSSPFIAGCEFRANQAQTIGGAVFNYEDSRPILRDCVFESNRGIFQGGALVNAGSCAAIVVNCTFSQNSSDNFGAGAVLNNTSDAIFVNCVFSGNRTASATQGGGAMRNERSNPLVINCVFHANTAPAGGGGLFNFNVSSPSIRNSVFWSNSSSGSSVELSQITGDGSMPSIGHSLLQGWTGALGGIGNSGADPLFEDPIGPDGLAGTLDDDLRIRPGSPAIDAGDSLALPADMADLDGDGDAAEPTPLDRRGVARFLDDRGTPDGGAGPAPIADIGAYEFDGLTPLPGDCNCDGFINNFDIDSFILAISDADGYASAHPGCHIENADIDNDGSANNFDIDPFILCITFGACP